MIMKSSHTKIASLTARHEQSVSKSQIDDDDDKTSHTEVASITAKHRQSISN